MKCRYFFLYLFYKKVAVEHLELKEWLMLMFGVFTCTSERGKRSDLRVPLKTLSAASWINFSPKKWKPAGDVLDVGSRMLVHHCQHPVLHGISVAGATRHHQWDFARSHQKHMTSFFCVEPPSKSRSAACVLAWRACSPCIKDGVFICVWWMKAWIIIHQGCV